MKRYRIIDNFEAWGPEAGPETIVDETELDRLAKAWDVDKDKLLDDLEELEPTCAWYLVDDCTTARAIMDAERLEADTQEEAVAIARDRFEQLSEHNKRQRDAYYIGLADASKEEDVDFFDTMREIVYIK